MIKIPDYIQNLSPYKPGNKLKSGRKQKNISDFINLASNENPLGASPKAIEALKETTKYLSIYPDVGATELISYLSEMLGKPEKNIIAGSGSDAIIGDIIKAFSDYGDDILTAEETFIGYFVNILKLGRNLIKAPMKNHQYDLEAIINSITPETRIIFLSNPNNPTGSMFFRDEFESFLRRVPEDILIVYDEAYSIYAALFEGYPDGLEFEQENLIVIRTFSKSHGLAGIRIGFAFGPEKLISTLYKVKLPFEPNSIAQKIALAALTDYDFIFQTIKLNTISIERLTNLLDELNINYVKPYANFVMILFENQELASNFVDKCYDNGILVRHLPPFGVPNGVRISTGTHTQMDYSLNVFKKLLGKK
jgi:histidinol-phosphate aminotransferase